MQAFVGFATEKTILAVLSFYELGVETLACSLLGKRRSSDVFGLPPLFQDVFNYLEVL